MKDSRVPDKMEPVGPECFEQYIPTDTLTYVTWHGIRMTVRHMISMREVSDIVNNVVSLCMPDDKPSRIELCELAIRAYVVMMYAGVELPADIEKQHRLLFGTGLYESVCNAINPDQLGVIRESVHTYTGR